MTYKREIVIIEMKSRLIIKVGDLLKYHMFVSSHSSPLFFVSFFSFGHFNTLDEKLDLNRFTTKANLGLVTDVLTHNCDVNTTFTSLLLSVRF